MKHKLSITILLLGMFLMTQIIGLIVIQHYDSVKLPANLEISNEERAAVSSPEGFLINIIPAFIIAFLFIFLLMKYQWKIIMRVWFLVVVGLALLVSFGAIFNVSTEIFEKLIFIIAFTLAYYKIFRPNVIIHNTTELLIYPGIAAIFVQFMTPITIIGLLVLISIYDMWAVWKSGIMQKMARFQMEELKIFGGFLIPSADTKTKQKIKDIKQKYKNKKIPKKIQNKKFKINFAILGGGDVVFPIIASGVYLINSGLASALYIVAGSFLGLAFLFSITKKDKAYPAMPYISLGIFLGMLAWELFPM